MIIREQITIPLYPGEFVVVFTDENEVNLNKFYEMAGEDDEWAISYGHACLLNTKREADGSIVKGFCAAFNLSSPTSRITHGVIAHEAFHITSYILEHIEVFHNASTEEVYSYLLGWVTDYIYHIVNKHKIQIHLTAY